MKIICVVDNYTGLRGKILGEHGLSFFIDVDNLKIYFDLGQTSKVFENNRKILKLPAEVDYVVISHGHYDHVGGLKKVKCKKVILHPDAILPKFAGKRKIGMKYIPENLLTVTKEVKLSKSIKTSGEIRRIFPVDTEDFLIKKNGKLVRDIIMDDLSLIIDYDGQLIVLTGCCHAGVLNLLEHINDDINKLIGGLHLYKLKNIASLVSQLKNYKVDEFYVGHCTGIPAFIELKKTFGNSVKLLFSGLKII